MDSTYIDSLSNKLFQLENSLNLLTQTEQEATFHFIIDDFYPSWIDIDSGLQALEQTTEIMDDVISMRIRLNGSQAKIASLAYPVIRKEIDEASDDSKIQDIYRSIRIMERISKNDASTLNELLQKKRRSLELNQTTARLYGQGKEINEQIIRTLNDKTLNTQDRLNKLENLFINEKTSLQNVKNAFSLIMEETEVEEQEITKQYSEICDWYDKCLESINPLRRTMDDLPTYLESEEYEKCFEIIHDAKMTGEMVNSFVSDDLEENLKKLLEPEVAEKILKSRWMKYSLSKYIKYQNDIEKRLANGGEDPRKIEQDFTKNTSKNLMPIDDLDWERDQKQTFLLAIDRLNRRVINVKNIDIKIDKAVRNSNPVIGFRLLAMENAGINDKPFLDSKYQKARTELLERCTKYIEDGAQEITVIYEQNPHLSIAYEKLTSLLIEIDDIQEFKDQNGSLNSLKQIIEDAIQVINELSADPKQALETLETLKKRIEEKGFTIPIAVKILLESCQSAIHPQETVRKLLNECSLPKSIEEIQEHTVEFYQNQISKLQNALAGIEEREIAWKSGEVEKERNIGETKEIIEQLSACRDYLYVQDEFKREKKDVARIQRLLKSVEKNQILLGKASLLKQEANKIQTADEKVEELVKKIEIYLQRTDLKTETLFSLFQIATELENQPSFRITELFAAKRRVEEILTRRLSKELEDFLKTPQEFTERLTQLREYIELANVIEIPVSGDLEGAFAEAKAWECLQKTTMRNPKWEESIHYWALADSHDRASARFHKIASLKALAIIDANRNEYASLKRARKEPILQRDSELSILSTQSELLQLEERYKDPRNLKRISGTADFDRLISSISVVLGLESDLSKMNEQEEIAETDILTFKHVWNQFYANKVPMVINAHSLKDTVARRKALFDDYLSIANKMRVDASIHDFQTGISLQEKIVKRFETNESRKKNKSEEYVLFKNLCSTFRQFTLEELRK